jgi:subtilisin family serine protease
MRWIVSIGLTVALSGALAPAGVATAADRAPDATPAIVGPGVESTIAGRGGADVFVMLDGHRAGKDVGRLREVAGAATDRVVRELPTGARVRRRLQTVPALSVRVTSQAQLDELAARPDVERIDLEAGAGTGTLANTVPIIGANVLQAAGHDGTGVTVAVLDSGADNDHPDLTGAVVHQACFGENFAGGFCPNGTTRQVGTGAAEDDAGHGTHVTGIVGSNGVVSSVGVAPGTSIVSLKVTDDCSFSGCFYTFTEITAALDYIVAHPELGVDVVNMSLGTNATFAGDCDAVASWTLAAAATVANLRAAGVSLVASSGNNSLTGQMTAPACLSGVISAAASDTSDAMASFANIGATTDVVAPGVFVRSDAIGGGTVVASGTSMASPAVAGCIALLHDAAPSATPLQIENALESTGTPVTRGATTLPRINCDDALSALEGTASGPAIAIGDVSIGETDSGKQIVKIPVLLSAPTATAVTVKYSVLSGTANGAATQSAGVDFQRKAGLKTLKFSGPLTAPVVKYIPITVYGDGSDETDETFTIDLSSPTPGWSLIDDHAVVTILDDDAVTGPRFAVGDASIVEGDSGKQTISIPVTLSEPITEAVKVDYRIAGVTATCQRAGTTAPPGVDCNDLGGGAKTLVFKPRTTPIPPTAKVVNLRLYPDDLPEGVETVTITLSNARPSTVGSPLVVGIERAVGTVTVVDDD